ncbi:hypothetical protein uav_001 [Pseudomonas phage UAVern]|uniref:Uncharacterized protein n=1 Tax=Pseudomonas phage UAVern TaxID=2856997 RepID=A0A975UW97_9CAUD|nr:hypothetical protein uav_001 [Pseudomonas phage UAVern]
MNSITTVHYATWQYVFDESVLHKDYAHDVRDKLAERVKFVVSQYDDVYENTSFCSQAEGFEIQSENLDNLKEAAREISRYIQRFRKIQFV